MRFTTDNAFRGSLGAVLLLGVCNASSPPEPPATMTATVAASSPLPPVKRTEMIEASRALAELVWTCGEENVRASCPTTTPYACDFEPGQEVTGVAYDWGGMDGPEEFERKLAEGHAAGSHKRHGVTACTAGIDCSGLVSLAWGQSRKFGTSTIHQISEDAGYDWTVDARPGDAFNKAGSHIVLFVGYRDDGGPTFYEAAGPKGRVVLNDSSPWSYLRGYKPIRYQNTVE
jgi:hypothetical protein